MSVYYPFDSLVRLTDLVNNNNEQDLSLSSIQSSNPRSLLRSKGNKSITPAVPRMDLIESKDSITAVVELPGLTKDKVDILLHDNVLTISGSIEHSDKTETDTFKSIERSYGSFARSIAVPPGLKQEEVKAKLQDGLLKVEIPKIVRESQAKKIEVE